jgi:hypothetical protein
MIEKIIKIKNRQNYFWILLLLVGCESQTFKYQISDKYSGPCIVFIYSSNEDFNDLDEIEIRDGLGRIGSNILKQKFVFYSLESGNEIEILPMKPSFTNLNTTSRYVFGLSKGYETTLNCRGDIHTVTFFIGKLSEYLEWEKDKITEIEYFNKKNIDWCKYYNEKK